MYAPKRGLKHIKQKLIEQKEEIDMLSYLKDSIPSYQ